ncbi:MAG: polyketide cyclase [Balneolaceae bacterium]|nr:polyketide cyclase [Balneolaceae bacterium]
MNNQNYPIVESQMLIRKPVSEVFEAMVNPDITSKFWFTKSSGRVEPGKTLEWEWGQFGVKDTVDILEAKPNEYISLQWKPGGLKPTVEMNFEPKPNDTTLFRVTEKGFWKSAPAEDKNLEEKIGLMLGQNGGWTLVLSNMKAWIEHGIDLNVIADHKPDLIKQSTSKLLWIPLYNKHGTF